MSDMALIVHPISMSLPSASVRYCKCYCRINATTIGRTEVNDDAGRGYATLGAAAKLPRAPL